MKWTWVNTLTLSIFVIYYFVLAIIINFTDLDKNGNYWLIAFLSVVIPSFLIGITKKDWFLFLYLYSLGGFLIANIPFYHRYLNDIVEKENAKWDIDLYSIVFESLQFVFMGAFSILAVIVPFLLKALLIIGLIIFACWVDPP